MKRVAVVGGRTSTLGFRAIGMDAYVVAELEGGPAVWESIPFDDYGLIFVTEPVYEALAGALPGFPPRGEPVVVAIPAVTGSRGVGLREVASRMERAIGAEDHPASTQTPDGE